MRMYAQLLAGQLAVVGYTNEVSSWQRSARASATMAELGVDDNTLVDALNVVYSEHERRGFLRRTAVTLASTMGPGVKIDTSGYAATEAKQ